MPAATSARHPLSRKIGDHRRLLDEQADSGCHRQKRPVGEGVEPFRGSCADENDHPGQDDFRGEVGEIEGYPSERCHRESIITMVAAVEKRYPDHQHPAGQRDPRQPLREAVRSVPSGPWGDSRVCVVNGCCFFAQCCPTTGDSPPPPDVAEEAADSRCQQTETADEPQPCADRRLRDDRPEDRPPLIVDGVPHDRRQIH